MDDAVLVRRFERLRNLSRDRQRFVDRNRAASRWQANGTVGMVMKRQPRRVSS